MDQLFNIIPESYFVKDLKQNKLSSIKLAILREVTGNMIIRSNYADETITYKISDTKDLVEIPARKLKSKEKLLGLKICREFDVVDSDVRYNVISKSQQLANPNSVLFGDSVTESGDAVGLKSRVIYDWAYSIRDVNEITETLQHNALSEGGTMYNEEKGQLRQSLFQVQYIKPNTYFPHFITLENVTPELLIHLLACVLYENRYGAQTTTTGTNATNHLVGIGYGSFEPPLNSIYFAKNWNGKAVTFDSVYDAMETAMENAYGKYYQPGAALVELVRSLWEDKETLGKYYQQAHRDAINYLKGIGIKIK